MTCVLCGLWVLRVGFTVYCVCGLLFIGCGAGVAVGLVCVDFGVFGWWVVDFRDVGWLLVFLLVLGICAGLFG